MLKFKKKNCEIPPVNGEVLGEVFETGEQEKQEVLGEASETGEEEKQEELENAEGESVRGGVSEEFRVEAAAFAKGREISAESMEEGIGKLEEIGSAWRDGSLTVEMLETVIRGLDYQRAVTAAYAEGELKGRNNQIEEKYMKAADSDGLPHPAGTGSATRSGKRFSSIFDLAREA